MAFFLATRAAPGSFRLGSLLLLAPCALAGGLGVWQLQRREWKLGQLAERQEQLAAQPLSLKALTQDQGVAPWRRVAGRGELRHKDAAFVRAHWHFQASTRRALTELLSVLPPRLRAGGPSRAHNRRHRPKGVPSGALASPLQRWARHSPVAPPDSRVLLRWSRSSQRTAAARCW